MNTFFSSTSQFLIVESARLIGSSVTKTSGIVFGRTFWNLFFNNNSTLTLSTVIAVAAVVDPDAAADNDDCDDDDDKRLNYY